MFGYVTINKADLSEADERRYRAFYCGLCRALGSRHGVMGRMTVTYDLTFLAMLLSSLYEPETKETSFRCAAHPRERREAFANEMIDYASDMNIALVYHKCLDDWRDDRRALPRAEAAILKRAYARVEARYPRQCGATKECLQKLSALEKAGETDMDACARCFGALVGEMFVVKDDAWATALRETGEALGQFIYMMDAYDDLPSDARRKRYNPLLPLYGQEDLEAHCHQILMMLMSDCTNAFETLPLEQDLPILRNILYSGVWTRFAYLRAHGRKGNAQ